MAAGQWGSLMADGIIQLAQRLPQHTRDIPGRGSWSVEQFGMVSAIFLSLYSWGRGKVGDLGEEREDRGSGGARRVSLIPLWAWR